MAGNRVLILSIYPAPYRVELFNRFSAFWDLDVFFISAAGDQRSADWFRKGKYRTLDTKEGALAYRNVDLNDYRLVLIYDYASKEGVRLIADCKRKKIPFVLNCDGVRMDKHEIFIRYLSPPRGILPAAKTQNAIL